MNHFNQSITGTIHHSICPECGNQTVSDGSCHMMGCDYVEYDDEDIDNILDEIQLSDLLSSTDCDREYSMDEYNQIQDEFKESIKDDEDINIDQVIATVCDVFGIEQIQIFRIKIIG